MAVRMKVLQNAVGGHDPQVIEGSSPDKGINWEPGDEIVVSDRRAEQFEASGMAVRLEERKPAQSEPRTPESAMLQTPETAVQHATRRRNRA